MTVQSRLAAPGVAGCIGALLLAGVAAAASGASHAQEAEPPGQHVESVSVGLVVVPVIVRRDGDYVGDLQQDDFEVLVDGRPVQPSVFESRTDAPVSLVVLQDLSGSMANGGKLEVSRQIVRYMIDGAGPEDEFAVVTFSSGRARVEVPFTGERQTLLETLASWRGYGTTGLHDAVAWLPDISLEGRRPKKAALLLTDGIDNASELTATTARDVVRRAQLPVYVFGLAGGTRQQPTTRGDDAVYGTMLRQLAERTAGRYYALEYVSDWKEAAAEVAEELRHQYVLAFDLGPGESRYRQIEVRVRGHNRDAVFARAGYEGPPPAIR